MEFRVLGPLVVFDGDAELLLGPAKERAVLSMLVLRVGVVVSRDQLVEALWGEAPPLTAGKALNVYVSQLRKTLARNGDQPLQTRAPGYVLAVDPGSVDAVRFERLAAAARERAVAGELEAASALMREALALWRGPALFGIELEDRGRNEVERLEQLRLAAELDRIDYELALGRHEPLVGELERLVAEHPLDERLRGQLILALYRCGRQADALAAYRDTRAVLVEQLGIEPGAPLQRLQAAILNQERSLEVPAGVSRAMPVARSRRTARLGFAATLASAGAALALFATGVVDRAGPPRVVANTLVRLDAAGDKIEAVTSVGALPSRAAATRDALWAVSGRDGTVSRVGSRRGDVKSISVLGAPEDVAAGEGAVWVASHTSGGTNIVRIDPRDAEIASTIPVPGVLPRGIAAGQGSVWLAGEAGRGSGGVLVRISAATNSVTRSLPLPSKPSGIEVGDRGVWIAGQILAGPRASGTQGAVYVIDPASGALLARGRAPFAPLRGRTSLALGAGAVWLAGTGGSVVRLDPRSARVTHITHPSRAVAAVAVSGGKVWAAAAGGTLYSLDPRTGRILGARSRRDRVNALDLLAGAQHLWMTTGSAPQRRKPPLATGASKVVISLPDGPTRIRYGAGSVWASDIAGARLFRIDPRTGHVSTLHAGGGGSDIGFGAGSVWATDFDDNRVDRIDPQTNSILARIPSGGAAPLGIAYADGAIWVANHHARTAHSTGSVVRIDPRRDRVVRRIPLGAHQACCGPDNMVAAFGSVWVDVPNQFRLVRIDARRTRVVARIRVPSGCGQLTAGAGSVWIADGCSDRLLRVDPRTNRIVARIPTNGLAVYPVQWHDGAIWVTTDDFHLLRIDPSSNSVVSTSSVAPADRPEGGGPFFAFGDGRLWISDFAGARIVELAPPSD